VCKLRAKVSGLRFGELFALFSDNQQAPPKKAKSQLTVTNKLKTRESALDGI